MQVRGFLIKKAHFSGKIEGSQQLLESTGGGSQLAETPDVAGRMVRWAVELSEFDVQYEPRGPIKGQVYTNFVVELSSADVHQEEANFRWVLSVNGSSNQQGSGADVILEGPNGLLIE